MLKPGHNFPGVSIGAMILNSKGQVLLSKRSQNTRNERGCWEIPGGRLEFGETLQNGVKREIFEELGIKIELIEQMPAQNHILLKEQEHWVPTCFIAHIKTGIPKIMEPEKCDAIGWFSFNQLPSPLSMITELDLKSFQNSNYSNNRSINS